MLLMNNFRVFFNIVILVKFIFYLTSNPNEIFFLGLNNDIFSTIMKYFSKEKEVNEFQSQLTLNELAYFKVQPKMN